MIKVTFIDGREPDLPAEAGSLLFAPPVGLV
jgi:hypothetical protein